MTRSIGEQPSISQSRGAYSTAAMKPRVLSTPNHHSNLERKPKRGSPIFFWKASNKSNFIPSTTCQLEYIHPNEGRGWLKGQRKDEILIAQCYKKPNGLTT